VGKVLVQANKHSKGLEESGDEEKRRGGFLKALVLQAQRAHDAPGGRSSLLRDRSVDRLVRRGKAMSAAREEALEQIAALVRQHGWPAPRKLSRNEVESVA
jgi:hypothetical protein